MIQPIVHAPGPDVLDDLRKDARLDGYVLPDTPSFRCPHCQTHTLFDVYTHGTHVGGFPERTAFDKVSRELRARGCQHRDFSCQGCGRAVRVVFGAIEFAMSSYIFFPHQVILGPPRR